MITGDLKKWLSAGTGIGVEIRGADLAVTVARVRPNEVRVLASTTIIRFRERPAGEWGAEYNQFVKAAGCGHLAATVLLPRDELIVRQLSFPGVGNRDIEAAVRYRADTLHPYPEGEASHGWTRLPDSPLVLVGIARTELIEHYATLFAEAGVRTASLTFSAVAIYSAIRIHAAPPVEGFLIVEPRDGEFEAYGESPARAVFTATFDQPMDRVVSLASAELRFEDDVEPTRLKDILPLPHSNPAQWDIEEYAGSYATALAGACPWLSLSANLLPKEQRSRSSRAVYVPTAALACVLLMVLTVLGVYSQMLDRGYSASLSAELAQYTEEAAKVRQIEDEMEKLKGRRAILHEFRLRTRSDMGALRALTILIEPPAWMRNLQMSRSEVILAGQSPAAAQLLEIIDGSPHFKNSEYTSPISGGGDLQNFSIRSQRESAPEQAVAGIPAPEAAVPDTPASEGVTQ